MLIMIIMIIILSSRSLKLVSMSKTQWRLSTCKVRKISLKESPRKCQLTASLVNIDHHVQLAWFFMQVNRTAQLMLWEHVYPTTHQWMSHLKVSTTANQTLIKQTCINHDSANPKTWLQVVHSERQIHIIICIYIYIS